VHTYSFGTHTTKQLRDLVSDLIQRMPDLRRSGGPLERIPTGKKEDIEAAVDKAVKEYAAHQDELSQNIYARNAYLKTPMKPSGQQRYGSPIQQLHFGTPMPSTMGLPVHIGQPLWLGPSSSSTPPPATAFFKRSQSQTGQGTGGLEPTKLFRNPKRDDAHYRKFGERLLINTEKLRQGVLSVIRPSGLKVSNLPNQNLTPALRECFKDFLDGEPMSTHSLGEKESEYLKHVFTEARLGKVDPEDLKIVPKAYVTKQNMRDKLMILMGQINGGNDNPKLLKQLSSMVVKLSAKGWLTDEQRLLLKEFL